MENYDLTSRHVVSLQDKEIAISTDDIHVWYGQNEAIKGVSLEFEKKKTKLRHLSALQVVGNQHIYVR